MKTPFNQIITIVIFFTMSLATTLVISWGMTGLLQEEQNLRSTQTTILIRALKEKVHNQHVFELTPAIKLLVPKTFTKVSG